MSTLPVGFKEKIDSMYPANIANDLLSTFISRPTTFRVNTIKCSVPTALEDLRSSNVKICNVPWCDYGFILQSHTKRELMDHPLYQSHKIYIQSLASMVPPIVLGPQPGEVVLDLTAAPGSKTSQIAALMNCKGTLIANDNSRPRFFKLKRNLSELLGDFERGNFLQLQLGHGAKIAREYPNYFDRVLLDAPCSAESRFINGDSDSFGFWKKMKVEENAKRQRQLLIAALRALKVGGILVYSTCTISPEENEAQVSWLLEKYPNSIQIETIRESLPLLRALPPITSWGKRQFHPDVSMTLRIYPDSTIESFFVAKLIKTGDLPA